MQVISAIISNIKLTVTTGNCKDYIQIIIGRASKGECVTLEGMSFFKSPVNTDKLKGDYMYKKSGLPSKQGLYDPQFEHDACGIGFVVNINGKKEHKIIRQALTVLLNLAHRGGAGSEENTGDGAGILTQIPHKFFEKISSQSDISLPLYGEYGVGMVFLPMDDSKRKSCQMKIEEAILGEELKVLGWRTPPVNETSLGNIAKDNRPFIKQIFIGKSNDNMSNDDLERSLYVVRKMCEKSLVGIDETSDEYFYFASLSSRTIVYKGMLTAGQVDEFYTDLADTDYESSIALVHSRYSTNTFPSWERAHPYRYLIHNGEINTLRGNINWMNAREAAIQTKVFGKNIDKIFPVINNNGSDSAMFDNSLEFLTLSGRSLAHSAMMMVPEPWNKHESMSKSKKDFYEFHSMLMEPWDGPAAMAFTDGKIVCAMLDRNGLRPSRYYVTRQGQVVLASEAGVLDIDPADIISKERLRPGRMLIIDTEQEKIISDEEIKESMAKEHPYGKWIKNNMQKLEDLDSKGEVADDYIQHETLTSHRVFGYTYEDLTSTLMPMVKDGAEPIGSMGSDTPIAILSDQPQLLFNYFKQLFAQVTNPPIDAIREEIVTSTETYIGAQGNILNPGENDCKKIRLKSPIITNEELVKLQALKNGVFKSVKLPILYRHEDGGKALETAMEELFKEADQAIKENVNIIILSDRNYTKDMAPIPSLLAVSGLHHHLIRNKSRVKVSIVLESGEPREVHHIAVLLGYGVAAVNPYMAFESISHLIDNNYFGSLKISKKKAYSNYIKALVKGIVKVISKMGISTIQSYQGAQIFEALGISQPVVDRYFTATPTRIGGITMETIALEVKRRHEKAFSENSEDEELESGGVLKWRSNGEYHQFNPLSVYKLQKAVRENDFEMFKEYSDILNSENQKMCTIRGLLKFNFSNKAIPLDEVESVDSIVKRFKTGAMSYGSISKEAHEALAIAMNRLGGKSNTGEGGEDPERFIPLENNDSKCSAIKQVASGRFGVNSEYLASAKEIQIKMAQGAKPGEGGQLPGVKVYPWIADTRNSTPGVGLISPPPHHDIYSIEDLSELIYDLKNANPEAKICVKLVSEVGVGTVAAGVAKGRADVVLISGYDGGTGASPVTSIRHAGLPWELGLAETHQTLVLNKLRSRITVETDGKLMTGRDVVVAAILGAEEFGFATAPLVALGCVMMRVCNLDTCPVGVATQNPELRKRFAGKPEHVVNFMRFVAQEMREIMAELGVRTINDLVGKTSLIQSDFAIDHWTGKDLDLSCLLTDMSRFGSESSGCSTSQNHELENTFDRRVLIPVCKPAIEDGKKVVASFPIRNTDRVTGTLLGYEVTKKYGGKGLPDDTINLNFRGSAGQSFGAFVPKGITLNLEGDSNDYTGKGLSGGKIIVKADRDFGFDTKENIIIGNVALYGATDGQAYINGVAGERFCVRNSGVKAVVEGVGDHGCEYMTGGVVAVLGKTGRNFAAGMSGGIAYVYDANRNFEINCNKEMVRLSKLETDEDKDILREMIQEHVKYTKSKFGEYILENFGREVSHFVKVIPEDYEKMIKEIDRARAKGIPEENVMLAAFEARTAKIANSHLK